jgi:hypothetical protein
MNSHGEIPEQNRDMRNRERLKDVRFLYCPAELLVFEYIGFYCSLS